MAHVFLFPIGLLLIQDWPNSQTLFRFTNFHPFLPYYKEHKVKFRGGRQNLYCVYNYKNKLFSDRSISFIYGVYDLKFLGHANLLWSQH